MTTLPAENEAILKVDAKGRLQMPAERREQLLDEFEKSGLSGAKFAALSGIKYQIFAAWPARRRAQRGLVQRVFGSSSEKLDPAQLQLLQLPTVASTPEPTPAQTAPAPKVQQTRAPRAPRLPDSLPVVEEVIDPEPVKAQPENWRCIGQEVTEQLDYEPGRFLKRRTVRRKYVHRTEVDTTPVIAPLPACLQERGLAAPGLLAHIMVSKFCDHLPLYRQEQIYQQRHGLNVPRQSMARWMELGADWVKPIYEVIRTGVLGGGYVQIDETPSNTWSRATAKPGRVTFGPAAGRQEVSFTPGTPAQRHHLHAG